MRIELTHSMPNDPMQTTAEHVFACAHPAAKPIRQSEANASI